MSEETSLTVRLLGGLRVAVGDTTLQAFHTSSRLQSLLAYLLLTRGTPHARTYLAGLFWPDLPEPRAHANLRKAVLELRRAVPGVERFLAIDHATVEARKDAPVSVDADAFSSLLDGETDSPRLERAVSLYRGDLLPHCYDDWIVPYRERLRARFVRALEELVSAMEARRDYAAAIQYAGRLLEEDPLQEAIYRNLMRLHALTGNRTGALRAYHACVDVLQRELNVSPSPLTQEAYHQLLHLDRPAWAAGSGRSPDGRPRRRVGPPAGTLAVGLGRLGSGGRHQWGGGHRQDPPGGGADRLGRPAGPRHGAHTLLCGRTGPRLHARHRPAAQPSAAAASGRVEARARAPAPRGRRRRCHPESAQSVGGSVAAPALLRGPGPGHAGGSAAAGIRRRPALGGYGQPGVVPLPDSIRRGRPAAARGDPPSRGTRSRSRAPASARFLAG